MKEKYYGATTVYDREIARKTGVPFFSHINFEKDRVFFKEFKECIITYQDGKKVKEEYDKLVYTDMSYYCLNNGVDRCENGDDVKKRIITYKNNEKVKEELYQYSSGKDLRKGEAVSEFFKGIITYKNNKKVKEEYHEGPLSGNMV